MQNLNSFAPSPVVGSLDLAFNYNTKSVKLSDAEGQASVAPGSPLKLDATSTSPLPVVATVGASELSFGVVIATQKKNVFAPGNVLEIASTGNVVYVKASAAINRGAKVQCTASATAPTAATATSGQRYEGIALDRAVSAGDLIRIEINPGIVA